MQLIRFKTISIALWLIISVQAQKLTIEECYNSAIQHHPSSRTFDILEKMNELEKANAGVTMLPQATLKANVSWQSDVTSVDLPIPGVNLPELAHDWYKLYLDVTQTIYDGGLSKAQKNTSNASMQVKLQEQQVNLYTVKGNVNLSYFTTLHLQKQIEVLKLKADVLAEQHKKVASGVNHGVIKESELDKLTAEQLMLDQQIIEVQSALNSSLDNLTLLTGSNLGKNIELAVPENPFPDSASMAIERPEIQLLAYQKELLDMHDELLQKSRRPKIYGYGQAGYGRPGLNMFNDQFDDWYIVGVGMQWKIHDWKETSRKREVLTLQKSMVDIQRETFLYQLELLTRSKWNEIMKYEQIINSDKKIISLRKSIAENAAVELENGVITTAEYINDLNNYTSSLLTGEMHQTALLKAKYEYITLNGSN
jgi:outer membrane protein TolC